MPQENDGKSKKVNPRDLLFTVVGGLGLLAATAILNLFFTTPPSRAEFDELKNNVSNIETKLNSLAQGQTTIINHLINKK